MGMQISVVIPTYNRAETLPRALESVLEQTAAVDEIIVVDDGSTDHSASLIKQRFGEVRVLSQARQGVSAARNRGIAAATHEWVALLDSDDSWLPKKIELIRQAWQQQPDFALYHSDEIWIRNGKRVNPMHKHRKRGGWIFKHCLPLCVISPSTAVIRKSVLEALGGFDPELPACEDYDLWLRLCHAHPVFLLEQALVTRYGGHNDQLSHQFPVMDRFRVRALHRLLQQVELNPDDCQAAKATLTNKLEILLKGAAKHSNQAILDEYEPIQAYWLNSENPVLNSDKLC